MLDQSRHRLAGQEASETSHFPDLEKLATVRLQYAHRDVGADIEYHHSDFADIRLDTGEEL